ncbi:MAG: hypothetical protein NW220_21105 [Leptolyngbyaceae cyanobacterium bins.349]|nr:hypothetical protein [Leptolyngbyaceae cyanobacterium bins.349]
MQIEFPNAKPLTPDDEKHLESLKALIEKSAADGVLTGAEVALIRDAIAANKKLLPEELLMVKTLIRDKVASGQLEVDLFDRLC